jgi:zinc and cadmium transporter
MILYFSVLLISAFGAGLLFFAFPKLKGKHIKLPLVFAGSYLFSVTVIHILPELFHSEYNGSMLGFYVLVGFFLQLILEYFTSGVEHGHIHKHDHKGGVAYLGLMIALCLHAFMEGTLLAHPSTLHDHDTHDNTALLLGIVFHKMPAAFALTAVIMHDLQNKTKAVILLLIFSLASPFGVLTGDFVASQSLVTDKQFAILFAIVSGNFLHISTTIFFESSPEHKFSLKKLAVSLLGAGLAASAELLF